MKLHFSGIGGNGMSALAQIHAMSGDEVTGSDRLLDKGCDSLPIWDDLRKLGIKFTPQDGSGVKPGLDALILSTAIEDDSPELARAKELGVKALHRAELLASHVERFKTIAVSGTSGKSTTTAMIFEILDYAGFSPSVITGANILSLRKKGYAGNVFRGKSDLLVIEADESDGSLVNYHPRSAALLNLTKDHKDLDTLFGYFRAFRKNCGKFLVSADEDNLAEFVPGAAATFGVTRGTVLAEDIELDGFSGRFSIRGVKFRLNHPGLYNVQNAVAAAAACLQEGVTLEQCSAALESFGGVARRFASVGSARGVEVIDDFAHNPAKITAALSAARLRGKRVLLVYQPHGFAPVRLLKNELLDAFAAGIRKGDILWLPEIYYAGGTADKSVSSKDLAYALAARGVDARFAADRALLPAEIVAAARPGDVAVVMGARDPTLSDYARSVLDAIKNS
ncbi:MAG: Mur ligase domain-containing protein [Elusimicrobiales bacterium]|nr:Mur ligase domain-containing protein [Elusimicrobiales bacterium]